MRVMVLYFRKRILLHRGKLTLSLTIYDVAFSSSIVCFRELLHLFWFTFCPLLLSKVAS